MAVHVNSALLPLATVILCGGTVIVGGSTAWEVQSMEVDLKSNIVYNYAYV